MRIKIALVLPLTFALSALVSCGLKIIISKGEVSKIERNISGFSGIYTSSGIDVELAMGDNEKVVVETNENIHQYIEVFKEGDVLRIKIKDNTGMIRSSVLKVHVTAKTINYLHASGGTDIDVVGNLSAENLRITLSGGGSLDGSLNCGEIFAKISGGGEMNINGTSDRLELNASGGSSFEGYGFITKVADLNVSGGGDVEITVNEKLNVSASGGSEVKYKGNAILETVRSSGGSRVKKQ